MYLNIHVAGMSGRCVRVSRVSSRVTLEGRTPVELDDLGGLDTDVGCRKRVVVWPVVGG